jgi:serine/threonine protein kinase
VNHESLSDARPGQGQCFQLGQYRVLQRLDAHQGDNRRSPVYKAVHVGLERTVALKILGRAPEQDAGQRQRFLEEIQRSAHLLHPNLIATFDAFESDGVFVLVMEYVKGTDLEHFVRQGGRLAISIACGLICQAALGLEYLHQNGLVHQNFQPKNLLIAEVQPTLSNPNLDDLALAVPAGTVKILNLGLSWRLGAQRERMLSRDVKVLGSADYLAPEQIRRRSATDIRSDLYSLGCTLYFALVGWPPFPRGTALEKLFHHQFEEPPPLESLRPEVPSALCRIVRHLLAKRPGDRYQTPAEVAADLLPFCSAPASRTTSSTDPAAQVPTPAEVHVADTKLDLKVSNPSLARRRRWPFVVFLASAAAVGLGAAVLVRLLHIFG